MSSSTSSAGADAGRPSTAFRTVIITGGAGFIGSHVADQFIADGWTVHLIDNLVSGKRSQVPAGAILHEMDIREEGADALIQLLRPTLLVHLAAQIDVRKSVTGPVDDASVNIMGSLALLEAVRRHSPGTRVVFASTGGAIYGDLAAPPNSESLPKEPGSPYAIAKLAVEHYLTFYANVYGIEAIVLRFANVYGPRQDPHGGAGIVAIATERMLDEAPVTIFGDGTQTRDYVYVQDVVRAVMAAATVTVPPATSVDARAFNIGTGVPTSVNALVAEVQAVSPIDGIVTYMPPRAGELQDSYLDVRKAATGLGWTAKTTLREGLGRVMAWYQEQRAAAGAAVDAVVGAASR